MFLKFGSSALAAALCASLAGGATAAKAPRLPASVAAGANDLQRAAWACEAGAPVLAPAPGNAGRVRYFLTGGGEAGASEAPLVLGGARLAGLGWLSDDKGWSVIRFSCALTPDLRRATSFGYSVIAQAAAPSGDPTTSEPAAATPPKLRTWQVRPSTATLTHSVEETDDRDFRADCVPHSGRITIVLSQTVPWLKPEGFAVVTMGDGTRSGLYTTRGCCGGRLRRLLPQLSPGSERPPVHLDGDRQESADQRRAGPVLQRLSRRCGGPGSSLRRGLPTLDQPAPVGREKSGRPDSRA